MMHGASAPWTPWPATMLQAFFIDAEGFDT